VSRLIPIEFSRLLRRPVTTIVSSVEASWVAAWVCCATGSVCAGSCANTGLMTSTPPTKVNIAFDFSPFNFLLLMNMSSALV